MPETAGTNSEARSLNFGDDLPQVDIPNSVGEDTEDMIHDDSSQPSRALFSRISQAEALNDELLKLLQIITSISSSPSVNPRAWACLQ